MIKLAEKTIQFKPIRTTVVDYSLDYLYSDNIIRIYLENYISDIKVTFEVIGPNGKLDTQLDMTMTVDGRYVRDYKITNKDLESGSYTIKTTLTLNGKTYEEKSFEFEYIKPIVLGTISNFDYDLLYSDQIVRVFFKDMPKEVDIDVNVYYGYYDLPVSVTRHELYDELYYIDITPSNGGFVNGTEYEVYVTVSNGKGKDKVDAKDNFTYQEFRSATLCTGVEFANRVNQINLLPAANMLTSSFTDSITFRRAPKDNSTTYIDVSANGDGSIYLSAKLNGNTHFDLYVESEFDEIRFNSDSSRMFSNFYELTDFNYSTDNNSEYGLRVVLDDVTNIQGFYSVCSKLPNIGILKDINNANLTNTNATFYNCHTLKKLDIYDWNVEKLNDCTNMFGYCDELVTIYSKNFPKTATGDRTFYNCSKLVGSRNYNSSYVNYLYANYIDGYFTDKYPISFEFTENENYLDINIKNIRHRIIHIDVKDSNGNSVKNNGLFNISPISDSGSCRVSYDSETMSENYSVEVTYDDGDYTNLVGGSHKLMFVNEVRSTTLCDGLTFNNIFYGVWNSGTKEVIFRKSPKESGYTYKDIPVIDGEAVYARKIDTTIYIETEADTIIFNEDSQRMFYQFGALNNVRAIDVTLNLDNVSNVRSFFYYCSRLEDIFPLTEISGKTPIIDSAYCFYCVQGSLDTLDLYNWDFSQLEDNDYMFYSCMNVKTIYSRNHPLRKSNSNTFTGCSALSGAMEYDSSCTGASYANYIDGYFTDKYPISFEFTENENYLDINIKNIRHRVIHIDVKDSNGSSVKDNGLFTISSISDSGSCRVSYNSENINDTYYIEVSYDDGNITNVIGAIYDFKLKKGIELKMYDKYTYFNNSFTMFRVTEGAEITLTETFYYTSTRDKVGDYDVMSRSLPSWGKFTKNGYDYYIVNHVSIYDDVSIINKDTSYMCYVTAKVGYLSLTSNGYQAPYSTECCALDVSGTGATRSFKYSTGYSTRTLSNASFSYYELGEDLSLGSKNSKTLASTNLDITNNKYNTSKTQYSFTAGAKETTPENETFVYLISLSLKETQSSGTSYTMRVRRLIILDSTGIKYVA